MNRCHLYTARNSVGRFHDARLKMLLSGDRGSQVTQTQELRGMWVNDPAIAVASCLVFVSD